MYVTHPPPASNRQQWHPMLLKHNGLIYARPTKASRVRICFALSYQQCLSDQGKCAVANHVVSFLILDVVGNHDIPAAAPTHPSSLRK